MYRQGRWLNKKNSKYACGIPIQNNCNFTRTKIFARFKGHSRANSHILACSDKIEENETIKMEPTEGEISIFNFENKIDEKTRLKIPPEVLEYLETRVMKKHTWMEIIDGKLFCQVNPTVGVVKFKGGFPSNRPGSSKLQCIP